MDYSRYKAIAFRRDGRVLHVTLNRPNTLNAIDDELDTELSWVFGDIARDPETLVAVLTGAGRAFSAGGNIDHMMRLSENPREFQAGAMRGKELIFALLDCPKPIIAKVNGAAMGLGATLALFCDLIYAADEAPIADPHVKVGLVAGDGGAVIWPALIGYARAKEYLLTGKPLKGAEAARIGLINHAVPAAELDRVVDECAQQLAAGASRAIQWTKLSVNIGLKRLAHSILDASFAYEALSNQTADHREALLAFRHKRAPSFTGD